MLSFSDFCEEVWDEPNPKKTSKKLTPAEKAKAKARAKAAGRPYPNLVDNMAVAKEEVEQIDELKRKTLELYRDAAKKDYEDNFATAGDDRRKVRNRLKGIARSMDKTEGPEHSKEAGVKPARVRATEEVFSERGADSKGYFRPTEKGAGLTQKGAAHFGIQTAVTEPNPTGKRASRRKSFCARMSGMKGPMKDEKGRPTRKAASLKRWRC